MKSSRVEEEEAQVRSWDRNRELLKAPPVCSQCTPTKAEGPRGRAVFSDCSKALPLEFSLEPAPHPSELDSPAPALSGVNESSSWALSDTQTDFQTVQNDFKRSLQEKCERVREGGETGCMTPLISIYTDLYITEGLSEEVSTQHEERHLEALSKNTVHEAAIRCQDVFKQLPLDKGPVRVVLSSGVAGVGKTFSVLKFCLDWAKGSENQELDLVLPLSFRELNLTRRGRYSLLELMHIFHPLLCPVSAQTLALSKVLFIFDGLDEFRVPLDFNCEVISEVTQRSEVSILLVNLIKGSLLSSALIWITSRPVAASRIAVSFVDRFTEVRGFLADKKAEYFSKRFPDEEQCAIVLSHIRSSRSLHTMCQIPIFCWITTTVLDHMLRRAEKGPLPQTLTDMYAHFLFVQIQRKKNYGAKSSGPELSTADCELLLRLGRLAFEHLHKGHLMFYEEDLKDVGLDLAEGSVFSGLCTKIFKQESIIFNKSVYCFVHLSVQEFLAAVYTHHCFRKKKDYLKQIVKNWDKTGSSIDVFLKAALETSLVSSSGHLDLFVRFLHGLTLDSNRRLLGALLGPTPIDPQARQRVVHNLKKMKTKTSPDRSINIFHCLTELNDHSVRQQIQEFLKSDDKSKKVSEIQCSALAHMLQMSEEVLEELDLRRYNSSRAGRLRLVPAVRNCTKALLVGCGLSKVHIEVVASALWCNPSHLRLLDLSENLEVNSQMKVLCEGLQSSHCRLQTLRLNDCGLSESSCASLASALSSNPSHLVDLELGDNPDLKDSGVERLCTFLQSPDCRIQIIRLWACGLSELSCASLASALKSNPSHLVDLELGNNPGLQDSGVTHLCALLQSPDCRLEILGLNNCGLTQFSCSSVVSALKSNPCSRLKVLELGENRDLRDPGVQSLCVLLRSPDCGLEALRLWSCGLSESSCASLAAALQWNPSRLRELDLGENPKLKDSGVESLCAFLLSPDCGLEKLSSVSSVSVRGPSHQSSTNEDLSLSKRS
ncbi:NACHT, LRR and PYD domains-containing protein 12-like isoform X2 [Boleophthalmus pectinirostris]|uniref:NACHT, LRR and PYD domains-containing protein 12-like isoform X2 n=1 Tax=Boleophthalmus pectinirostris TaxID=150288 RepID=UPI00242B33AE|nr:NACHT, LRR and PYD domains-containing protein 12-like isoform X2 [Boleophthalmus pectinirostris]